MSHQQADNPEGPTLPIPSRERKNILVVDDTPANLRLLSQMLAEQGYHVRPVPDGPLALAAVQAEPPDLILLDIRMPGMDGYQVCEQLKADAHTCDIPIIFISALDATQDKVKAFHSGGVDYVTKPFQNAEVLARVETHLALRELQRQLQEANERMVQELSLAGEVQASLLPRQLPGIPDWQYSATLIPARETSGDFYDLIPLPNDRLGLVMADVTDKGAGAALYMALSCTLIRTYAQQYPVQPELVLGAANRRLLTDTSSQQFVTVFYGILEPATGKLVYVNAGHCPPLHFRAARGGDAQELTAKEIPLGILEDKAWQRKTAQIDPGDLLVLYTDGITEARTEQAVLFGEGRLLESVRAHLQSGGPQTLTAREIQETILADVRRFAGDAPQYDDIALAILRREQGAAKARAGSPAC